MLHGAITALITPFKAGEIDWNAFDALVEWQIDQGIHGLVPCGTTGESPTLTHEEHIRIVERCVDIVNKRVPVIAGTGSNNFIEALYLTKQAKDAGADVALVVMPYYNKPTQEGMYAHYKKLAEEGGMPIIIYNIPGRSVVDMNIDTMARLAELPNIIGVKDATNDLQRPTLLRQRVSDDFCLLSGEDGTAAAYLAQGGHGCISVTSNIAPKACADLQTAWRNRDMDTFAKLRDLLTPLHKAMFVESSPQPVKYAGNLMGLCTDEVRLPLVPASKAARAEVDAAMAAVGLGNTSQTIRAIG